MNPNLFVLVAHPYANPLQIVSQMRHGQVTRDESIMVILIMKWTSIMLGITHFRLNDGMTIPNYIIIIHT